VSAAGRRNVAERVIWRFNFDDPLGAPAQVGKFFYCQWITGIMADRTALFNCSTEIISTYREVSGSGKMDYWGTRGCGLFQQGSRETT
jgi:hypothetical protein